MPEGCEQLPRMESESTIRGNGEISESCRHLLQQRHMPSFRCALADFSTVQRSAAFRRFIPANEERLLCLRMKRKPVP
jgi:hypothetical protein